MDSLATLATVLQHAQSERDQAVAALRQAEAAAQAAQQQNAQLQTYRGEYHERWSSQFRHEATVPLLECYQGFGGRLDQAITMQTHTATQADTRVQKAREVVLAKELRVAAVTKLIERRRAELQHMAARRDQRQTDETAARLGQALRQASASL